MSNLIYDLEGCRGRHIQVFDDKVVLSVKASLGSFIAGNVCDGEKTIYYTDCIGVQFKKSSFTIGYLQFETASGIMNNRANNFFNENTFTWDRPQQSNEKMEEVSDYVKGRVEHYKNAKNTTVVSSTPADEIKKYKELLDMGIISREEFDAKKRQLLGL